MRQVMDLVILGWWISKLDLHTHLFFLYVFISPPKPNPMSLWSAYRNASINIGIKYATLTFIFFLFYSAVFISPLLRKTRLCSIIDLSINFQDLPPRWIFRLWAWGPSVGYRNSVLEIYPQCVLKYNQTTFAYGCGSSLMVTSYRKMYL